MSASTTTKTKVVQFSQQSYYDELVANGTVTVEGVTYTYSPSDTIYATPISVHNYSTTEQVVGTWIDGKPIYERTISIGNVTKNSDWSATSFSMPNIDCMMSAIVSCVFPSGQKAVNYGVYVAIYNDYLNYYNPTANATDVIAIIQYTKTTDTAEVAS